MKPRPGSPRRGFSLGDRGYLWNPAVNRSVAHLVQRPVPHPGRGLRSNLPTGDWDFQSVRVVDRPIRMEVERNPSDETRDHFWITISVAEVGPVLLTINTRSMRNLRAGFEDRIRVGRVRSAYHCPRLGECRVRDC